MDHNNLRCCLSIDWVSGQQVETRQGVYYLGYSYSNRSTVTVGLRVCWDNIDIGAKS